MRTKAEVADQIDVWGGCVALTQSGIVNIKCPKNEEIMKPDDCPFSDYPDICRKIQRGVLRKPNGPTARAEYLKLCLEKFDD